MFNIVEKRRWYFIGSGTVVLLGIAAMLFSLVRFGAPVRMSIDFTGGSLFVLHFDRPGEEAAIRAVFAAHGLDEAIVQRLGAPEENAWQVRTREAAPEQVQAILADLDAQVAPVNRDLLTYEAVSPIVGGEVTRAAGMAVAVASVIILAFIWWSFRRVPHAFRYGAAAIIGMLHDILVALGFYVLMGILQGWEVDALFLTAILTVSGFSVQDTIVVFDRIRENLPRYRGESFGRVANRSILETIHRSLATQLNAIFVMVAIILFGGETIRPFISTMLVGMLSGTYSSIFIAVPLVVMWERRRERRTAAAVA
ncbi:MAG TPA: protein translocase subunit SecF [Anaerolineales bacterium]|nr:protein translocase subunit SecF [Anaerolineae bacterium]HIQ01843.1 protein translocase subunit SecF [Anaerolineales bacterium]